VRTTPAVAVTIGLLLIAGGAAASATTPSYTGAVTFGAPTVTRVCTRGVVTSVSVSVPYNATHLTAPLTRDFYAQFGYHGQTLGYILPPLTAPVTIRPRQVGVLQHTFPVSAARVINVGYLGISNRQWNPETVDYTSVTCTASPTTFLAPVVASVSHRCLGTTAARVVNGSSRTWTARPLLASGAGPAVTIAPHTSATVRIGLTSRAERFTLAAATSSSTATSTVALIVFNEACTTR